MTSRSYLPALGLLSLILYLGLTGLSKDFNWGEGYSERPILEYLFIYFSLFVLYALACAHIFKSAWNQKTFWTLIVFGLLFRAAILPSQQIQEDDVYRYLWDGKVFAHGINPFKFAPDEISEYKSLKIQEPVYFNSRYDEQSQNELAILNDLKWEHDTALRFMERINHADVPTIYPPLAQIVFRLSQHIKADSIVTLRILFLAFDLMGMVFIVLTLRSLNLNQNFSLVYFWSPLILKETFNSTHLDIIGISCLCVSVYFLVRGRMTGSIFFLALSVLGKLYSGILLPFYLQKSWMLARQKGNGDARIPALQLFLFCAVVGVCYLPFIGIGEKAFEGLKTYSMYWQSNDSLFALLLYFLKDIIELGVDAEIPVFGNSMILGKSIMALVVLGSVATLLIKNIPDADSTEEWVRNLFIVMTLVFLISPVQNPWYLCWVIPFLCLFHSRSLILLTGLVGLYYLDFYFDYQDLTQYSVWIAWFEYTPFYLYLIWELKRSKGFLKIFKSESGSGVTY
jgi:hypothetical protein